MGKIGSREYRTETGKGYETDDGYIGGYATQKGAFILASVQSNRGRLYTGSFDDGHSAMRWVKDIIAKDRRNPLPPTNADIEAGRAPVVV